MKLKVKPRRDRKWEEAVARLLRDFRYLVFEGPGRDKMKQGKKSSKESKKGQGRCR